MNLTDVLLLWLYHHHQILFDTLFTYDTDRQIKRDEKSLPRYNYRHLRPTSYAVFIVSKSVIILKMTEYVTLSCTTKAADRAGWRAG